MDSGQVYVKHVIRTVIVGNLATGPVDAFDLDDFVVLDGATEWVWIRTVSEL